MRHDKLDSQTDHIGHDYARQHGKETIGHYFPERESACSGGQPVLIAGIVHAEEQTGHQGKHHNDHHTLGVETVMDIDSGCRCCIRCVKKGFKPVEHAAESVQLSFRLKIRFDPVKIIS